MEARGPRVGEADDEGEPILEEVDDVSEVVEALGVFVDDRDEEVVDGLTLILSSGLKVFFSYTTSPVRSPACFVFWEVPKAS